MDAISLTIDGKQISCAPGTSILEAAEQLGLRIPTLCHHPALKPYGACRLCLVEDKKTGRLFASCVTPVSKDLTITTDNQRLRSHRRNIIRLMMAEHPESCIVCNKGNRCQLREIAATLGVGQVDLYPMTHYAALEQANPFIIRDLNKCILCGKCIRADHELVNVGAIDYNHRGFNARPAAVYEFPLEDSNCTFCGTCVSICPTGALSISNTRYVGTPQREALSVCGYCGVGCSLRLAVSDNAVVDVNPGDQEISVNGPTLCVRGHFAHDFLDTKSRLRQPLILDDGELQPTDWDRALDSVAAKLLAIKAEYGPQSIGFIGSTKCTNEENYLFQKIARAYLNTNNIDNGSYLSGRSRMKVINEQIGGYWTGPLADLLDSQAILIIGADPPNSAPVLGYFLKRAARKGIPLVVVDPRKTELVMSASSWLPVVPGSDVALINGLALLLSKYNSCDFSFINQYTEGFSQFERSLRKIELNEVARITGLKIKAIERASTFLKGKRIAIVAGHGILLQHSGSAVLGALLNLALMTGSVGKKSSGFYFVARDNNEVGASDMGTIPDFLPGRLTLTNDRSRKELSSLWQCNLSPDAGLNMIRMIEEAERGGIKALYIMGENVLRSLPQTERARAALSKLHFLVVQDILLTETARMAHVVLPGAAFSEKEGSFTNLEGRIQPFNPVVSPPGEAWPDWAILDKLTVRLGAPKEFGSLKKIRSEISAYVSPYASLGKVQGETWIADNTIKLGFGPNAEERKLCFASISAISDDGAASPNGTFDKTAIISSLRYHLGSGTRTSRSQRMFKYNLRGDVHVSPQDAERLKLSPGDAVRVVSPYGAIERTMCVDKTLMSGLIFVPTAFNGNDALKLLALAALEKVDSPGWNACSVRIERC